MFFIVFAGVARFPAYGGLDKLNTPSVANGRLLKHSFEHFHEDGRLALVLKYDVELAHEVSDHVFLDKTHGIHKVVCDEDRIKLTFFSAELALMANVSVGKIMTGSHHWRCANPWQRWAHTHAVITRRVKHVATEDGTAAEDSISHLVDFALVNGAGHGGQEFIEEHMSRQVLGFLRAHTKPAGTHNSASPSML